MQIRCSLPRDVVQWKCQAIDFWFIKSDSIVLNASRFYREQFGYIDGKLMHSIGGNSKAERRTTSFLWLHLR
jgi:hypothetical protein